MNTKALRQKILDLAIHGKLLPKTVVEQCRNQSDYESAEKLLEKIRAEKAEKIKKGELKADKRDSFIFVGSDKRHYEQFADGTVKDIEDEIPFDVPEGWAWARGSDIFHPMTSKRPVGDTFRYIDIDAIDNKKHCILFPKVLSVSDAPSRASRELNSGDILFSLVRPYLENIALVETENSDCIASTGFYVCKPKEILDSKFAFYLMTSDYVVKGLNQFMKGDNSPSISSDDIVKWYFPLPPLNEQERIVSAIETIFAQTDILEQNKSDLQTAIKQAKSKILDLAIHGKLVPQDPTDEPAEELLKRLATSDNRPYEKVEEEPFEIPQSWCWVKLGGICDKLVDGDHNPPKGIEQKTEFLMLSSRNINHHQIEDLENVRYLTKEIFEIENKRTNAQKGDILFTSVGSLGRSCIFKGDKKICFQRSVSILHTKIYNHWLKYFFDSTYYQNYVNDNATGTAQMGFYLQQMSESPIALPPLAEQHRIVAKIEELFSVLDQIQSNLV